jgi:NADH-ubiquinone oxidoreductase chain 5
MITNNLALKFVLGIVILAAITKSAQIPFSAWLPAAIAAPTPVSALVHSSTLVTAGVYLLIRFNVLLGMNSFILYLGALTIFMSGLGANFEIDLKKIIALSTLSQLGVIIFVLSMGYVELAFFHLLTHALFKSLLFLCAGAYIHGAADCQDIRFLGGVAQGLPVSSIFFISCSISLCGFPFLSGFYSKDLILEMFIVGGINNFILFIILVGTLFTVTYSFRLGVFVFLKNLGLRGMSHFGETLVIAVPIRGLYTASVLAGSALA